MRISAKADYAVRATLELAASPERAPVKGTKLAAAQEIPLQFLEQIMLDLKRAGLVRTKRGASGGYWLAMDPSEITVADVIRAVEGPLANIHDLPPEETSYPGPRAACATSIAVRVNLRAVLEQVTLAQLVAGELPDEVADLIDEPGAWQGRETGTHDADRVSADGGPCTGLVSFDTLPAPAVWLVGKGGGPWGTVRLCAPRAASMRVLALGAATIAFALCAGRCRRAHLLDQRRSRHERAANLDGSGVDQDSST